MSARAFALSCVFLAAVSAFGTPVSNPCAYRADIERYQVELLKNDPRDRWYLVNSLQCLRSASLDSTDADTNRETRISNLEDLALSDFKRLVDRLVILDSLSANGSSPHSETEYANVRESIRILKAVVAIADGKPALVPTLFTKKRIKDKNSAAEKEFKDNCLSGTETPDLADIAAVKRCVDILDDKIQTEALIAARLDAASAERKACDVKTINWRKRLDFVEDAGVDVAADAKKDLAELRKKADKETDEAEKKKLADAITKAEADIQLITEIAVEPAAKRHCLTEDNVDLDDAESVQRCIFALNDAIAEAKFAAETPEVRAANDRIADLKTQLARISDAARMLEDAAMHLAQLKQQKVAADTRTQSRAIDNQIEYASSKLSELEQVPLSSAAHSLCGSSSSTSLALNDKSVVEHCIEGLRAAIAMAADEAARLSAASSKAHQALVTLEHRRVRALKRGVDIAGDRAKQSAAIAKKLAAAKDAKERDALQKQIDDADAEVVRLTEIAVDPDAETTCVEDGFGHLDIQTAKFVTRCIGALSRKVREVRASRAADSVNGTGESRRKSHTQLAFYELQLTRYEEAGRRMAHLKQEELAENAKKHTTASDDEKKKLDEDSKVAKADLDALRKVVIVPNEDPQTEYADFEQWFVLMTGGYEYVGATDAFARGFGRIGMTIGFHYPGNSVPEEFGNWRPFAYGSYSSFTVALTNSGEAKTTPLPPAFQTPSTPAASGRVAALDDTTTPANSDVTAPGPVKRALEFEFQSFHPFWRNDYQVENPRLRNRVGTMVVIGGRKVDDESFLHHRIYAGLRVARSPEVFADMLVGRTGGLLSHRFEARGQYAFPHTFAGGARLSIGAVGNFGLNKRRHEQCEENSSHCHLAEKDVVKFYVLYDIDALGFLSNFGLDKKPPAN